MTGAEAADILGCSESLIRKRIQSGTLTASKEAGRWQIRRDDLNVVAAGRPPTRTDGAAHRTDGMPTRTDGAAHRTDGMPHSAPLDASDWRDDLLAQVARLEANEGAMRADFDTRLADSRQESGLLVESAKARIIDLERELTVRDSRFADMQSERDTEVSNLREQVSVLEAKVRETLEERAEEIGGLAREIAGLVKTQQEMQTRVYELEPVASQVPMLQAAVEEKDASLSERERQLEVREHELSQVRDDIDAIASKRVTGPVFRLLTKGRLRR